MFHAPPNVKVWHKAFFWWVWHRAVAHTRPAFPRNAYGPVGIPLIRGASGAGRLIQLLSKGGKSLGEGPLRPKEIFQPPSHTWPDPCRRQHGPTDSATECHFMLYEAALHLLVCPARYGIWTSSLCGERLVIPSNGSEDKKVDDDTQGFTSERWHGLC